MRRRLLVYLTVLIGVLTAGAAVAGPLELLTAKEAAQPNLPLPKQSLPPIGEFAGGPQIIVDKPTRNTGVQAPFPIKIRFVPSDGAKVNLDSLEFDVLKLIKISLISRVKPYLTPTGINVPEAQIPAGTYNIHIALEDDRGHRSETTQTWTIH